MPSSFAAFAATTSDTGNKWTVPNWVYPTEVNNLGPYLYWRLEETGTAGTAADSSGNGRTGTYYAQRHRRQLHPADDRRRLVTDTPDNAVTARRRRTPASTRRATTAITGPNTFTEIIWFKAPAGYTGGGKLIGFETPRTGVAVAGSGGTYDRHVYMDGNGRIWFGVYNGGDFVISSGTGLNDGAWHMAAATLGAGRHAPVRRRGPGGARTRSTAGEATTGWWRVGCGNLSGWADGWTGANTPPASTTASNYVVPRARSTRPPSSPRQLTAVADRVPVLDPLSAGRVPVAQASRWAAARSPMSGTVSSSAAVRATTYTESSRKRTAK